MVFLLPLLTESGSRVDLISSLDDCCSEIIYLKKKPAVSQLLKTRSDRVRVQRLIL